MSDLIYKIKFLSDWHCGSGLTAGSDVDLLVIKDKNRLPFVPGKTLKGLFKEAANVMKDFSEDKGKADWDLFIKSHFGIQTKNDDDKKDKNEDSNQSSKGKCYFSNAVLSGELQNNIIENKLEDTLLRKISATKIDDKGIAVEHSLRAFEVVIPLELYGKISDVEGSFKMGKCLKYIKQLGTTRNRGLGRCIISIMEDK